MLIYAWMPTEPEILSYTSVDQEPGFPHLIVGGPWLGDHEELITYSRHVAIVGNDGRLGLHSGIVPGEDPLLGAALNGLQLTFAQLFDDGFESGDLSRWSAVAP